MRASLEKLDFMRRTYVTYRTFDALSRHHTPREILVHLGPIAFPNLVLNFFPDANLTVYEPNLERLAESKKECDEKINFTFSRPSRQFDTVISCHMLHFNPKGVVDDLVTFTQANGFIALQDYDMKGLSPQEFYDAFGKVDYERKLMRELGPLQTYKMHTAIGLNECMRTMHERGIAIYQGENQIKAERSIRPFMHYYYVGQKR